jgi:uncharacterized membrane protein
MFQMIWQRLQSIHRFFLSQLFYPLALSSALAVSLFIARAYYSHRLTFVFLTWNLFLAWIPYLCSLWITSLHQRASRRWWHLVLPSFVWLIFLPNAPYLVTDLLHLDERLPVPFWYDIGMLASFAWTGCFLAIASIRAMQNVVQDFSGRWLSWLFVLPIIGLSGVGIYLGRFMNWNSWDLLLRPQIVLMTTLGNFAHPIRNPQPFAVTALFAAFLLVAYFMFTSVQYQPMQERE